MEQLSNSTTRLWSNTCGVLLVTENTFCLADDPAVPNDCLLSERLINVLIFLNYFWSQVQPPKHHIVTFNNPSYSPQLATDFGSQKPVGYRVWQWQNDVVKNYQQSAKMFTIPSDAAKTKPGIIMSRFLWPPAEAIWQRTTISLLLWQPERQCYKPSSIANNSMGYALSMTDFRQNYPKKGCKFCERRMGWDMTRYMRHRISKPSLKIFGEILLLQVHYTQRIYLCVTWIKFYLFIK